jgi:hypothetical protein
MYLHADLGTVVKKPRVGRCTSPLRLHTIVCMCVHVRALKPEGVFHSYFSPSLSINLVNLLLIIHQSSFTSFQMAKTKTTPPRLPSIKMAALSMDNAVKVKKPTREKIHPLYSDPHAEISFLTTDGWVFRLHLHFLKKRR